MKKPNLVCQKENRRHAVRAKNRNGLDYVEVSDDQRTLTVYFLGKAPQGIQKENVLIRGGRRVTGIRVVEISVCRVEDQERDDCMMVRLDKFGDFSVYTLCLVEIDENQRPIVEVDGQGHMKHRPLSGFDPRYACLEFTFKAACPTELDCKPRRDCPPAPREEPDINYLVKDYASFRQSILDRLALIMPDWRERHVPDLGITLVELLAHVGDHLSYYQDSVATEAYLATARQRISVRRHARLVDYLLHEGCNARAWVTLWVSQDLTISPDDFYLITEPENAPSVKVCDHADLPKTRPRPYTVFEALIEDRKIPVELYEAHNEIRIYSWGDAQCCLPKGATSATLLDPGALPADEIMEPGSSESPDGHDSDVAPKKPGSSQQQPDVPPRDTGHRLRLAECDVIIFEEVKGPRTGNPADANPGRRHAVRLTKVTKTLDPLTFQLIVEIEWAQEDALPFPVCVSSVKQEDCSLIPDVSVVRGNVLLVDHGERVEDELGEVPVVTLLPECGDECSSREELKMPGWYRPPLPRAEVTFGQPLPPCVRASQGCSRRLTPACALLRQDVGQALPHITLLGTPASSADSSGVQETWEPRQDLLSSGPADRHFVVEIDNGRRSHLRFGDGELGKMPGAGMTFRAQYRVGNGPSGNVGADTITYIVFRNNLPHGLEIRPRNPLPAVGGTAPEPIAEAKIFAPRAFRKELQRAIVAQDYARLVMRDFKDRVQAAAAKLRWTGSWYEVLVAVDPLGRETAAEDLLCEIAARLSRYRRIGHDVTVKPVRHVPLDMVLFVCVLRDYLQGHVEAALQDVFSNRRLPDGRLGFFHPDNLTFGEGIYLSQLVAAAQAVEGVESVEVVKLERLFEGANREIENGILPLGPFEVARLDNDPSFPENGRLSLDLRGGR